jgi:hypothetical protein
MPEDPAKIKLAHMHPSSSRRLKRHINPRETPCCLLTLPHAACVAMTTQLSEPVLSVLQSNGEIKNRRLVARRSQSRPGSPSAFALLFFPRDGRSPRVRTT